MQRTDEWKSGRLGQLPDGTFAIDRSKVFAGSWYIAELQWAHYAPIFRTHLSGSLLDAGCGQVPYYAFYRDQVTAVTCIDKPGTSGTLIHLDAEVDLGNALPFPEKHFDSVLLSDVIAHVYHQRELFREVARVLRPGGKLVLTTPFVYWASEYPHEYFHPTDQALRAMCADAGLEVVHLEPYGGYPDVLLDTLNKGMTGRWSLRCFLLLASLLKKTRWMKNSREKSRYSYPPGYTLVAMRPC